MNIWENLPKPFLVLAPMDDVTDTVFRRLIADCARPDLLFTEFASVDGFQSPGRPAVEKKLRFYPDEQPLVIQIWGTRPENFEKTARELAKRGFAGIDLNMGCPVKKVIKQGACSALIANRDLAHDIIEATQRGAGDVPVSIKTRIGQKEFDESWIRFLLEHKPTMLTIHFRTVKELSAAPAHWEYAGQIIALRDEVSPKTLLVGNGDVESRQQAIELAQTHGLDGIMIGRGIFQDPYLFAETSPWETMSADERIGLFRKHVTMFAEEWGKDKNPAVLKRFAKVYLTGFDGAKELREQVMHANSIQEIIASL